MNVMVTISLQVDDKLKMKPDEIAQKIYDGLDCNEGDVVNVTVMEQTTGQAGTAPQAVQLPAT